MNKKIIMLMGCQRSGTNALFKSLDSDSNVSGYNESQNNKIYYKCKLRPEKEFRSILLKSSGTILLKPISEGHRKIKDIIDEFNEYDLLIVGLYRDPINVFFSWNELHKGKKNFPDFNWMSKETFVNIWNKKYKNILEAMTMLKGKMIIVNYKDLIDSYDVFKILCDKLSINGKYEFRCDSNKGYKYLTQDVKDYINQNTKQIYSLLEKHKIK